MELRKISEQETELYIYGLITKKDIFDIFFGTGQDKTEALTLKDALKQVDTPNLTVRINSKGGDVDQGLAIYGLLSTFKGHVKTVVDGFACSVASVIFMAGKERIVPENGVLLIHNAWTSASGDSNAMKKVAEDLEKVTQPSIDIYTKKTKLSEKEIKALMDRETWITSKEAFDWGFSTSQTREGEYQQSIEADMVHHLVVQNKELQKQIEEIKQEGSATIEKYRLTDKEFKETLHEAIKRAGKQMYEEMKKDLTEGSPKEEPVGLFHEQIKNKEETDSWESFFNAKNERKVIKNEN